LMYDWQGRQWSSRKVGGPGKGIGTKAKEVQRLGGEGPEEREVKSFGT